MEEQRKRRSTARERRLNRQHQADYRARQKEEQLKQLVPEKVWTKNRANLPADAIQDLESRQNRLAEIACAIEALIEDLTAGKYVGPPDGTFFPDSLYEEVREFNNETNPDNHLVVHFNAEEFVKLHLPENKKALEIFSEVDPEWFDYGYHTRLTHDRHDRFLKSCVDYFRSHEGDEKIDPVLAEQAIREYDARHLHQELIFSRSHNHTDADMNSVAIARLTRE